MTPQIMVAISQFLSRTTIKPEEIQTFQECLRALQELHEAATAPPPEPPEVTLDTNVEG